MDGRCVYFVGFSRELIDRMEALYDRGMATDTMKVSLTDMWTYSDYYFDDSYDFIDSLRGRLERLFCRVVRWWTLKRCKSIRDKAEKFLRMAQWGTSSYWHRNGELRQRIFRLGQPWPWSRIGGKNRRIFGPGNSWERWRKQAGKIKRMFGKSDLETPGRAGGKRVWKFIPEILSGDWAFFWSGPLTFCQHFLPNSQALIPTNSPGFNSLHFTRIFHNFFQKFPVFQWTIIHKFWYNILVRGTAVSLVPQRFPGFAPV